MVGCSLAGDEVGAVDSAPVSGGDGVFVPTSPVPSPQADIPNIMHIHRAAANNLTALIFFIIMILLLIMVISGEGLPLPI